MTRTSRIALAALTACAIAAPAASADAGQDLRMPDTRDGAVASIEANARQDLRSPDTGDAAEGRGPSTVTVPEVTVVRVPGPAPTSAGGIDWADAGIGGAVVLVLVAGAAVSVRRQQRRQTGTAIA
jgi:hypothetical protein